MEFTNYLRMKNELRIGNLVSIHGREDCCYKIVSINEEDCGYEDIETGEYFQGNAVKPIKVSSDWLKKFGFNEAYLTDFDGGWMHDSSKIFYIQQCANTFTINLIINDSIHLLVNFDYVHQLQNKWYELTEFELILNNFDYA